MPFRDQLSHYPATLGAKTAIARIALDPSGSREFFGAPA